ncbi:MAG: PAC2 family protein [Promethearchaeota archaeon]
MIIFNEKVDFNEIIREKNTFFLIVGMPGIGSVGKIVVESLVSSFNAKIILEILFDDLPSQALVDTDGKMTVPSIKLYAADNENELHFLFLSAEFQPSSNIGMYNLVDKFMKFTISEKKVKINLIIGAGAYNPESIPTTPKVYITGTDLDIVKKFKNAKGNKKILTYKSGSITGLNGLFPVWGKFFNIPGICLLAETIPMIRRDPRAALSVLETINNYFGLDHDFSELKIMAKTMDIKIQELKKKVGLESPENKKEEKKKPIQSYIS